MNLKNAVIMLCCFVALFSVAWAITGSPVCLSIVLPFWGVLVLLIIPDEDDAIENFMNRGRKRWIVLKCIRGPLRVKLSEIVAYKQEEGVVEFWLRGSDCGFICIESIESFETKLGIKKEEEK